MCKDMAKISLVVDNHPVIKSFGEGILKIRAHIGFASRGPPILRMPSP
jgi:hypothetical protein